LKNNYRKVNNGCFNYLWYIYYFLYYTNCNRRILREMTLEDLKRLYREYYVEVLSKEQNRGYTTTFEKNKLEKFRKLIAEGENNAEPKLNNS
jgi:hypothetical protein